jgi:small G protein signaling modulator 3
VKQVFEYGMKRPSFLGGPCHPWLFIEEAASREIEKDFESVYSRLILCKTYRLDEDSKVLTPEELLFRCVQSINQTHEQAQMDVRNKFEYLIDLKLMIINCRSNSVHLFVLV